MLARAIPRAGDEDASWDLDALGEGADEYQLEIDAERGVLLRIEAKREGLPFSLIEAVSVEFDHPIAPKTFVFEPPAGEELRTVEGPDALFHIPIHDAAKRAPFTVFVLPDVPPDWRLEVTLFSGLDRPPVPPQVALWYRSKDATVALTVSQTTMGWPPDEGQGSGVPPWEELQHEGIQMKIRRRTKDWPQPQLTLTRDQTVITMHSDELAEDDLIRLAASLVPAPETPPSI